MASVLVYEFLSAGGDAGVPPDEALALRAQGTAMRDAIVADLLALPGVAVVRAAESPDGATPPAEGARLQSVAPRRGESPSAFVARVARGCDHAWVVAPESGGVLAALHAVVDAARWLGCRAPAIAVASSKRATAAALANAGVPTPQDFAAEPGVAWIVKPDDGAGCVDTRRHRDRAAAQADVDARRRRGQASVLEPWVDGEALSVALLVPDGGPAQWLAGNRQHVDVAPDGMLTYRGVSAAALDTARDARVPALTALMHRVVQALPGLRGFVGIDVVWHPRRGPVVVEVNPRTTSAYVGLSARLGCNVAGLVLAGLNAQVTDG